MLDPNRLSIHQTTLLKQCTTRQFIDVLARNGVGCASLWREKTLECGVGETKRLVTDNGIAVSGYCIAGFVTAVSENDGTKAVDDCRRAFEEAATLGAPHVIFISGGVDPAEKDLGAARRRALERVARLVPFARQAGVKIALEPLHPMLGATRSALCSLRLTNDWCDALDAEDVVGIAVDTYCVFWDPEIDVQIERSGRRICSFHVNDWLTDTRDLRVDRGMIGDGLIDIPALRRKVEAAGYDKYIEVEVFSERDWWRRDPDEVVKTIKERVMYAV
jgi:sugar phosphate isomerase/epimerase